MNIKPFILERWQSIWENRVGINLSESGVLPLSAAELVDDPKELERVLQTPLGYPQTNGSQLLRSRVAELYAGAAPENVLMTSGCSEANFIVTWALIEPGDEVVFMQPNYLQIRGVAEAFGASVKPLWLHERSGWSLDREELEKVITPKTKLISVCNPNNPTGAVMSEEALGAVCARAAEVGAWVLADEVYRGAEFDGVLTPSMWGRYERVLCTGGLSKAYSLPGLRTGWVAGPADMIERLWGVHDYTSIGISMMSDKLAAIAMGKRRTILERTRAIIRRNYGIVSSWINGEGELFRHVPPAAGAMAWVGYDAPWHSGAVVELLRAKKDVLLVPGSQLGMDKFFRIGFGGDSGQLTQGLQRFAELLHEIRGKAVSVQSA